MVSSALGDMLSISGEMHRVPALSSSMSAVGMRDREDFHTTFGWKKNNSTASINAHQQQSSSTHSIGDYVVNFSLPMIQYSQDDPPSCISAYGDGRAGVSHVSEYCKHSRLFEHKDSKVRNK
jgi:hypothetical protein